MKLKIIFLTGFIFFFCLYPIRAEEADSLQTIGLVLSGGGAKGIAHIGVIQALEENEIPIDYITGTSMGAIVGGLYSIGYSPEEMILLFLSEDFYRAYSGNLNDFQMHSFRAPDPKPDMLKFTLSMTSIKQVAVGVRGFALVDPGALNLKLFELFSSPAVAAGYDFDRLFIPFRCVASDIYKKQEVVFKSGRLDQAIQASISIPFYFRPIENEDKKVLIDGGVYNNLPIKPMKNAFSPNFIIAVSVANGEKKPIINDDLGEFIINMVLQRSDSLPDAKEGLFIDVPSDEIGMMDFAKVKEAYDIGYKKGLEMVDSIKQQIRNRRPADELQAERSRYKNSLPLIKFDGLRISGVKSDQEKFFEECFHENKKEPYSFDNLKQDYLNLLAGNPNLEIIPGIVGNDTTGSYSLLLNIRRSTSPKIAVGANISSMNANQLYIGVGLSRFKKNPIDYNLDLYWGNTFNSVAYSSSLESGGRRPIRYQLAAAFNYYRYTDPKQVFFEYSKPLFDKEEYFIKLKMSTPTFWGLIAEASAGIGFLQDKYSFLDSGLLKDNPTKDAFFKLGNGTMRLFKSNLNHKMYPSAGSKYDLSVGYYFGRESYEDREPIDGEKELYSGNIDYFRITLDARKYFPLNRHFTMQGLVNAAYSNKPISYDYESTVIQASGFTPTSHSLTSFNINMRANKYLALGVSPVWKINSSSQLRFDNYLFMPIESVENIYGKAEYGDCFKKNTYLGELSLIMNLPVLSLQLFANYYSRAESNFNFGLNIGYLIFGEKFFK